MLLQQFFTSENTVVFDSKTSNLEDSNFSNISHRSTYPVSNFIPNTYSPSLSPASTISSEWSTATTASPGYIAPPPPYTTAVANLNQEKRRFSGGLEVHTDFQTSTSGPQRAPSGSGTSSSSSVFFSPYSQAASSCSTIRRESLDYSSDSFPSSKNFSDWKLGICNSELSSSLENIPMDDLLTPSPHASPYNFESVSEEEHSQHEQAPPTAPQRQQQPQSAGQFQQQRVGQPSSASTSSQSQHNRQSPSVAPPQQPPRQSRPHQSSEMFGSSLASHHQIPHSTPALNAVPPQFRQLHHSHSTSEILVNPHVQQQVQPRRNDQIDHELLDLIDRIVSENRGESTDSLEARQAPLAIVSTESVAGTSTTPHTSQAGSIEPPQLMEDKASTSGQQPSLQNPPYPFGQLNLRQIKEEIENSQAIHSSLQLPANPSSIAELSAEMQQYLRSAQQQMPSYQAPMLFGPGFNFTQAGSVQQPSTMDQFMQPQSFKTHPFGSSAATATVLATATPFDYSPLFGTSTSGGNTISSFYQQQGQSGSSGIGLPSAGSHLVTTSLDSRRGSHGTTSSGSTNSHTGTPSPLSHNNPHHSAGSVFAAASSFRSCFDSNPFSLVHGANLMHIAGAGSSDMPSSSGLQMQTSIVTSSSSACDDQKLCAVCNDHAICQHYGARTCEGCKGFFKRTVQKKAQYVCAGNKNCPIDKRYRSRCQYCRFQKCIAVGMVKEVVRYGVLSGRRGRLPSKAKTSAGSQLNDQPPSPPLPILTIIAKAFADTRSNNPLMTTSDKNFTVSEMMEILEAEIMSIFNFIQKIPDMVDIKSDQQTLLWWSFFPLFALKQAYRITELNLVEATFIFENGQVAKLSSIPAEFRSLFEEIHKVAQQFRNLVEWDLASFTALLVLQYLGVSEEGPRPNLVDQHSVDRLHSTIINALKDHCCNVATPQPSKLAKIVAQVSQFSNFRTLGVLCLELVRKSGQKLRDLLAEIYHSCYDVREAVGESSADQEGQSQVGQTGSVADQADLPASSGTTAEKVGFRLPF